MKSIVSRTAHFCLIALCFALVFTISAGASYNVLSSGIPEFLNIRSEMPASQIKGILMSNGYDYLDGVNGEEYIIMSSKSFTYPYNTSLKDFNGLSLVNFYCYFYLLDYLDDFNDMLINEGYDLDDESVHNLDNFYDYLSNFDLDDTGLSSLALSYSNDLSNVVKVYEEKYGPCLYEDNNGRKTYSWPGDDHLPQITMWYDDNTKTTDVLYW